MWHRYIQYRNIKYVASVWVHFSSARTRTHSNIYAQTKYMLSNSIALEFGENQQQHLIFEPIREVTLPHTQTHTFSLHSPNRKNIVRPDVLSLSFSHTPSFFLFSLSHICMHMPYITTHICYIFVTTARLFTLKSWL